MALSPQLGLSVKTGFLLIFQKYLKIEQIDKVTPEQFTVADYKSGNTEQNVLRVGSALYILKEGTHFERRKQNWISDTTIKDIRYFDRTKCKTGDIWRKSYKQHSIFNRKIKNSRYFDLN